MYINDPDMQEFHVEIMEMELRYPYSSEVHVGFAINCFLYTVSRCGRWNIGCLKDTFGYSIAV